ncbi:hypothetical protein E4634_10155 [Mangrovimicrobium sediminis]|uniref:Uncharacterized protein n=1 Tax=Mangrovimicrobium sediminis TaxID=2562682 RepID=A0A4Z0M1S5_9GAMM|nr:hypothetical protein [Haliea sp. SAOS-164]TGD73387.1 hypothetical protein E4634_10155 [Haliea sp. SAOS-164]
MSPVRASRRSADAYRYSSRDWLGKASAGLVCGVFLALGAGGLLARFALGGVGRFSLEHQFTMWLVSPLLLAILCACFMFRSGLRAWAWLGAANLLVWGLLLAVP